MSKYDQEMLDYLLECRTRAMQGSHELCEVFSELIERFAVVDDPCPFDKQNWLMTMTWLTYARMRQSDTYEISVRLGKTDLMEKAINEIALLDSEHARLTTMFKEYSIAALEVQKAVIESESLKI